MGDVLSFRDYVDDEARVSGERVRSLAEILDDLEDVAANFDKGWRAEPPTMAALIRRIIRELKAAS